MEHSQSPIEISKHFNISDIFDYDKNFENISKYVETFKNFERGLIKLNDKSHYYLHGLRKIEEVLNNYDIKIYFGTLNTLLFNINAGFTNCCILNFYTDHNIVINLTLSDMRNQIIDIKSINNDEICIRSYCVNEQLGTWYNGYFEHRPNIFDSINKAIKYIHPSIYIDYLLHCSANELNDLTSFGVAMSLNNYEVEMNSHADRLQTHLSEIKERMATSISSIENVMRTKLKKTSYDEIIKTFKSENDSMKKSEE